MRRPPQDGQKPRRLHEKGTRRSWPQSSQCRRRKPQGEDAATQEGAEFLLDEVRRRPLAGSRPGEEGL
jgi:hypothetical protein